MTLKMLTILINKAPTLTHILLVRVSGVVTRHMIFCHVSHVTEVLNSLLVVRYDNHSVLILYDQMNLTKTTTRYSPILLVEVHSISYCTLLLVHSVGYIDFLFFVRIFKLHLQNSSQLFSEKVNLCFILFS